MDNGQTLKGSYNQMTNYQKGIRFERELVNAARKQGSHIISFRSAGSKSIVDVCVIDTKLKTIRFIQAKTSKYRQNAPKPLVKVLQKLDDEYLVKFEVLVK